MKQILYTLTCLFLISNLSAQTFNGQGDGTSWEDPDNWSDDAVPAAGATVSFFTTGLTITGTVTDMPNLVRVGPDAEVTLDLDITIGDGMGTSPAIRVRDNSMLTLGVDGNNRTIVLSGPANRAAITMEAAATFSANLTIAPTTTLNITQGTDGISYTGDGTNVVDNNGTIDIDVVDDAVVLNGTGTFNNAGTLSTSGITRTCVLVQGGGTFNNLATGIVNSIKPDDTIINIEEGAVNNDGTMNLTVQDNANRSCIIVGTATTAGTFTNTSNNSLNADGGLSGSSRAMTINEMGTVTNSGTMTMTATNSASIISSGSITNEMGGTIDMTNGRMQINDASSLTNNGLIKTDFTSPAVQTPTASTATIVNNGFYDYPNSGNNNFKSGSGGTLTDNGINLNDAAENTIDAGGTCMVDIAEVAYEWFEGMNVIATADNMGALTFPANSASAADVTLTTTEYGDDVMIMITNLCTEAFTALPIDLVYFQAKAQANSVLLSWQTASETNNAKMNIERSADGKDFFTIGSVEGAGNSTISINYTLEDKNPLNGVNYYRLVQIDKNGGMTLSDIKEVIFKENTESETLTIYPTQVENELTVDLSNFQEETLHLDIFNTSGQLVQSYITNNDLVQINVSSLPKGMYFIKVNNSKTILSATFIK